jgi:hypothetical protein
MIKFMSIVAFAFLLSMNLNAQIVSFPPNSTLLTNLLFSSSSNGVAKNLSGDFFKIDSNNDGQIQVSEASQVSYLFLTMTINNTTGLTSFVNLRFLNFSGGQTFNSLNLVGLNLQELNCSQGLLLSLNLGSMSNLQVLNCYLNYLTSIDVNGFPNLTQLICGANPLTSINLNGPSNLLVLDCSSNNLTSLNLSTCPNLQLLYCQYNNITSLNLAGFTSLHTLGCFQNNISTLSIVGCYNLITADCSRNQISTIDLTGCTGLQSFNVNENNLTSIIALGLLNLTNLDVAYNNLTTLNANYLPALTQLNCGSNSLTSLYLKNGSFENGLIISENYDLQYICADALEVGYFTFLINQAGYNCIVDSACVLESDTFSNENLFTIYPNPSNNFINITNNSGSTIASISVYNTLGQLIQEISKINTFQNIDVSNLKSGNYFMKISADDNVNTIKFIKN